MSMRPRMELMMNFETLTHNLKNYRACIKKIPEVKEELDDLIYEMSGVKGVSYDQIRGSFNPYISEQIKLDLIEKYNEKENELLLYESIVRSVDMTRRRIPLDIWVMLSDKFIKGMSYDALSLKYNYSKHGMWAMLRRETERYL